MPPLRLARSLTCLGLLASQSALALTWSPSAIATLGGDGRTWANALNNNRQVVGSSPSQSGNAHAFSYYAGQISDLGYLGNGPTSYAASINQQGWIVGSSHTGEVNYYGRPMSRPFVFRQGRMTALNAEGFASDISDNGLVTGSLALQPGDFRASIYDLASGNLTQLQRANMDWSSGYAVNNQGQMVGGFSAWDSDADAFVFDARDSTFTELTVTGYNHILPVGINESGLVAGTAYDTYSPNGTSAAFLYHNGVTTLLNSPTGLAAHADGLNDRGDVVGSFQISAEGGDEGTWHAFYYGRDGWQDLNDYIQLANGAWLYRAVDINDSGDILAYASDGTNYLLSHRVAPVPEPETWLGLLAGTLLLAGKRLKRRPART